MTRKLFIALAVSAGAASFAFAAIGPDWSSAERVSDGIALVRLSYDAPRLIKAQAVRVDLSDKSLFFAANGRDRRWGRPMPDYTNLTVRTRRVTAEEFLANARAPKSLGGRGLDMILAFNTALWTPCPEPIPTPYAQTHGLNVSEGVVVSSEHSDRVKGIFAIWKNGGADILTAPLPPSRIDDAWIAHSGWEVVLRDGKPLFKRNGGSLHPRTAIGLSSDRRWLYVLVVEGRHEGVSLGADYGDLAEIMLSLGASDAVNMDGGGSTELVRWDEATQRPAACFMQETPPRRDALYIGVCRRRPDGGPERPVAADRFFETAIDADFERSAGIYHHYEFEDVRDTPPPEGYKPFYVSHYGRHGSRFQVRESKLNACAVMEEAEKADVLNPPGKALLFRLRALRSAHQGMFECLSLRGAEEHKRLAHRMHDRFPGVFSGGGKVRCQATTYHRCLASMANFACSLKGMEPELDFSFETGESCKDRLLHSYGPGDEDLKEADLKKMANVQNALLRKFADPDRLMRLLFKDAPATRETVKDPYRFVKELFDAASAFQSLDRELDGMDIYDFFTREERLALARFHDSRCYVAMGISEEFGNRNAMTAKRLLSDMVERADEAVRAGDVCADLRFGHDSGLMPLLCLVGLEGLGARVPAAEAWKVWPLWKYVPMAANLQIVLYRNGAGDCIAKVLLNERETVVDGLPRLDGPYYRWHDLRAHLAKLAAH
ncbi:MAG: phosphodiester glycosidase family protein [Kiritimatiellae bacterium]|nr:phosphodiester glycosidase family protein [Kiritimatiellia bacterium]